MIIQILFLLCKNMIFLDILLLIVPFFLQVVAANEKKYMTLYIHQNDGTYSLNTTYIYVYITYVFIYISCIYKNKYCIYRK